MIPLGIAALAGLAIALLVWAGREGIMRRYRADAEWLRETSLRFDPKPMNAEALTLAFYSILGLFLVFFLWMSPNPFVGLAVWLVLLAVPRLLVNSAWKKRKAKIDQQLPAAITSMCNSIRAGLTLVQALQRLADHAPAPIKAEFQIMASRYAYGADLESTIREAKERLALANFNLFASALLLNREMGGDVAETLSRISQSLDKLQHMRKTVEAHTSEGRTNIKVLMCRAGADAVDDGQRGFGGCEDAVHHAARVWRVAGGRSVDGAWRLLCRKNHAYGDLICLT